MRRKRNAIKRLLVREAARLMYEEGVTQYLNAKRIASKRILGKQSRFLPSNGETSNELHRLAMFDQGDALNTNLFKMRLLAMDVMEQLTEFYPRLIGSVSTGRIRQGSDVDLHVFTESVEKIQNVLEKLGWEFELKQVWIQKNGRPTEYTHIYLSLDFPVELSVYPENEIRVRGRSSTDGKPIERLSPSKVRDLVIEEHADEWNKYLHSR